jgi:hypothetical protein
MTPTQQREVVKFAPNTPVEVALKFAGAGKIISTRAGERVLYSLADDRVMFLDLGVAQKVQALGVNVQETFFICKPSSAKKNEEWTVWLSPETEKDRAAAKIGETPKAETSTEEESPLERQLRESLELVKQGKIGEVGNGTFVIPAGASALTPAPVQADASTGHRTSSNGNGSTNGHNGHGNGYPKRPETPPSAGWTQALLSQTNALVDVYAAALSDASTKHGNQVKPEDVRSLLVTAFIQRSKDGPYGR